MSIINAKSIVLESQFDISNIINTNKIVCCSIGAYSNKYLLSVSKIPERINGMFPQTKTKKEYDYIITELNIDSNINYALEKQNWSFHMIEPVEKDKYLLICARSHYRNGDPEKNAKLFNKSGSLINEFVLGDGLQSVKVTEKNNIWTSYFDEGIFGNYGWDNPLGFCGLRKWDLSGNPLFLYSYDTYQKFICDCYAMNVINDEEVWFYFYTDFEIGIYKNGKIRFINTNISGASCFLVHGQYVMFDKGYQNHGVFQVFKLSGDNLKEQFEVIFKDINGNVLIPEHIDYRGSELIFVSQNKIYCYDLINIYNY